MTGLGSQAPALGSREQGAHKATPRYVLKGIVHGRGLCDMLTASPIKLEPIVAKDNTLLLQNLSYHKELPTE